MNRIIKKLKQTLFALTYTSCAISIYSSSAGANVIAERDMLVNNALLGSDQHFYGSKFSTAAILSNQGLGVFAGLDYLKENMSLGVHFYSNRIIDGDPANYKMNFDTSIKFKLNNNFYLGGLLGGIIDNTHKIPCICRTKYGISPAKVAWLYGIQSNIFLGTQISIDANRIFFVELSYYKVQTFLPSIQSFSFNLLNLNIGVNFKIREFYVDTRFSNFINFADIKGMQIPAFTVSATKDISWTSLSFGAKTNLNFEPENILGFLQATLKL